MSEKLPEIGSAITYIAKSPTGANVLRTGIILGFGVQRDGDKGLPPAHVAYLDTVKAGVLTGSEWRNAFSEAWDVPFAASAPEGHHSYSIPEDASKVRTELLKRLDKAQADLKAATDAKPGPQAVAPVVPIAKK